MDTYALHARLYPALLALLPAALSVASYFKWDTWAGTVVFLASTAGVQVLVMTTVRSWGLTHQAKRWQKVGGNPTALRLRWAAASDADTHADLHRRVQAFSRIALPTAAQEAADPTNADKTYSMAVARLRERTRAQDKYPRVNAELASYGFARNAYGAKAWGLGVAVLTVAVSIFVGYLDYSDVVKVSLWAPIWSIVFGLAALLVWTFAITPEFVERASDRYADALLSAADVD